MSRTSDGTPRAMRPAGPTVRFGRGCLSRNASGSAFLVGSFYWPVPREKSRICIGACFVYPGTSGLAWRLMVRLMVNNSQAKGDPSQRPSSLNLHR